MMIPGTFAQVQCTSFFLMFYPSTALNINYCREQHDGKITLQRLIFTASLQVNRIPEDELVGAEVDGVE